MKLWVLYTAIDGGEREMSAFAGLAAANAAAEAIVTNWTAPTRADDNLDDVTADNWADVLEEFRWKHPSKGRECYLEECAVEGAPGPFINALVKVSLPRRSGDAEYHVVNADTDNHDVLAHVDPDMIATDAAGLAHSIAAALRGDAVIAERLRCAEIARTLKTGPVYDAIMAGAPATTGACVALAAARGALEKIVANAGDKAPAEEDYDDMESAYSNGVAVANWEAAVIAREGLAHSSPATAGAPPDAPLAASGGEVRYVTLPLYLLEETDLARLSASASDCMDDAHRDELTHVIDTLKRETEQRKIPMRVASTEE